MRFIPTSRHPGASPSRCRNRDVGLKLFEQLQFRASWLKEAAPAMNLFGLMETSGSAMQAERMRAEVVAANMANAETTRTASGGPLSPSGGRLCRQPRRSWLSRFHEFGLVHGSLSPGRGFAAGSLVLPASWPGQHCPPSALPDWPPPRRASQSFRSSKIPPPAQALRSRTSRRRTRRICLIS